AIQLPLVRTRLDADGCHRCMKRSMIARGRDTSSNQGRPDHFLRSGMEIFDGSRGTMLNFACSVISPLPLHAGHSPDTVPSFPVLTAPVPPQGGHSPPSIPIFPVLGSL